METNFCIPCGYRLVLLLLPSATKLQRLCFYTCLSFCPWGGAIPACIADGIPACLAAGAVCSWGGGAWSWGVCICSSGGVPGLRGVHSLGGLLWAGCLLQGVCSRLGGGCGDPLQKQTTTVADCTHPTGMHSCFISLLHSANRKF